MGKSRRKEDLQEALRPLGDAGLPGSWGDFWYGPSQYCEEHVKMLGIH